MVNSMVKGFIRMKRGSIEKGNGLMGSELNGWLITINIIRLQIDIYNMLMDIKL